MKAAYGEMLDGALAHPNQRQWYAVWFIYLKSGEKIGDLCFKGVSAEGSTEIGYGILPEFWGKGYAAEAVGAAVKWALTQPGIGMVEAETEPGISRRGVFWKRSDSKRPGRWVRKIPDSYSSEFAVIRALNNRDK